MAARRQSGRAMCGCRAQFRRAFEGCRFLPSPNGVVLMLGALVNQDGLPVVLAGHQLVGRCRKPSERWSRSVGSSQRRLFGAISLRH